MFLKVTEQKVQHESCGPEISVVSFLLKPRSTVCIYILLSILDSHFRKSTGKFNFFLSRSSL